MYVDSDVSDDSNLTLTTPKTLMTLMTDEPNKYLSYGNLFFNWGHVCVGCSDRGSFANPHLGEFLTPWISPLGMIFVGWQRFSSCYVVISRLEKPGNNNMR